MSQGDSLRHIADLWDEMKAKIAEVERQRDLALTGEQEKACEVALLLAAQEARAQRVKAALLRLCRACDPAYDGWGAEEIEVLNEARAALSHSAATGEGADAYKGKVGGADGIVRPVMPWSERVREAEARPAAPPLCDPECVHCAAWRGR